MLMKLLILPMTLLISLTSCSTPKDIVKIDVPLYTVQTTIRPTLDTIPKDAEGAIKALTKNMGRLITYIEQLEFERDASQRYYETIINIIGQ